LGWDEGLGSLAMKYIHRAVYIHTASNRR